MDKSMSFVFNHHNSQGEIRRFELDEFTGKIVKTYISTDGPSKIDTQVSIEKADGYRYGIALNHVHILWSGSQGVWHDKVDNHKILDLDSEMFIQPYKKDDKINFQNQYEKLLSTGKNADFYIHIRDKTFQAHRLILETRSEFFRAHFEWQPNSKEIHFDDKDPELFSTILHFIYTGKIGIDLKDLPQDKLYQMLDMSQYLLLEDLKFEFENYLHHDIKDENVISLFEISGQYGLEELRKRVIDYVSKKLRSNQMEDGFFDEICEIYPEISMKICKQFLKSKTHKRNAEEIVD